jgi:hypothetical protein
LELTFANHSWLTDVDEGGGRFSFENRPLRCTATSFDSTRDASTPNRESAQDR